MPNQILQKSVDNILGSGLSLHLMGPGKAETKLSGYKHKLLPKSDWNIIPHQKEVVALADWAEWIFGEEKGTIQGFYVKDKDGHVVWEEKFKEGPIEILRKGDKLRIRPKITFGEEDEE